MVVSSMISHVTRSYAANSLELRGLIRTVTKIFSSRTFGPPGVHAGDLLIFDDGVTAATIVIFSKQNLSSQKLNENEQKYISKLLL